MLDFDKDIYGVNLTLEFVEYVRAEKKFESIQALTDAIANDEKIIRQILS
jgi:riboflavin kinase/FMN adenylyltransferase